MRGKGQGQSKLFIVPRNGEGEVQTVLVDPHFVFHYANGFEDSEGNIVMDGMRCEDLKIGFAERCKEQGRWIDNVNYSEDFAYSKLTRFTLHKPQPDHLLHKEKWSFSSSTLSEAYLDFPAINPAKVAQSYRFIYALSGSDPLKPSPFQGIVKIDTSSLSKTEWFPPTHEFLGEPCFIPKTASIFSESSSNIVEDSGYIAAYLNNGIDMTTSLVIFDASNISKGPISRSLLSTYIPFGFHGSFAPGLVNNCDDIQKSFADGIDM
jgi:all-trans-8'-apo-beta-carotenal 15,15'-oxygenase